MIPSLFAEYAYGAELDQARSDVALVSCDWEAYLILEGQSPREFDDDFQMPA
jgi:hypothetical protein